VCQRRLPDPRHGSPNCSVTVLLADVEAPSELRVPAPRAKAMVPVVSVVNEEKVTVKVNTRSFADDTTLETVAPPGTARSLVVMPEMESVKEAMAVRTSASEVLASAPPVRSGPLVYTPRASATVRDGVAASRGWKHVHKDINPNPHTHVQRTWSPSTRR